MTHHYIDYPEAHIALIDALRDYIMVNDALGQELLQESAISRDQYEDGLRALQPMRQMLSGLEQHGIDPSLHGLISRRLKL
jgi:hypothetical protein